MPVTRAAGALVASLSAALLATTLAAAPATALVEEPPRPPFYEAPATLPAGNGDVIRSERLTLAKTVRLSLTR